MPRALVDIALALERVDAFPSREVALELVESEHHRGIRGAARFVRYLVRVVMLEEQDAAGADRARELRVEGGADVGGQVRPDREDRVPPIGAKVPLGEIGDDRLDGGASLGGETARLLQGDGRE